MARALKKESKLQNIDRTLLIATIILVFLGVAFNTVLNSARSAVKRDKIAKAKIESTFLDSEIAYLWSYYKGDGSKTLISEYLVSNQENEIQRIKCVWEDGHPHIVIPE